MAYTFKQNLVSSSKYSIKCPYTRNEVRYIVIHNTYNDASAKNEVSYHNSNNNQVSFHIAVDDIEAIQCVDFGRNSWSCGDGVNGQGNRYGISLEICYSKSGGAKYTQAEENAVYVAARLLHQYGLGIDKLKQHADFANKNCPHRIRDEKRWEGFKGRVEWVLDEIKKGNIDAGLQSGTTSAKENKPVSSSQPAQPSTSSIKVGDRVKVKAQATHYVPTDGLAQGKAIPTWVNGSTYTVTKVNGNKILLSDIVSWVWDFDLEKAGSTTIVDNSFKVKIICNSLNIRQSNNFNSKVVGTVKKGEIYTIVQESNGLGLLKSYATNRNGWISMGGSYVQKI